MPAATVVFDGPGTTSLTFSIDGPERVLTVDDQWVTTQPVPSDPAIVLTLADYEWLVHEIEIWLRHSRDLGIIPGAPPLPLRVHFAIGRKIGLIYPTRLELDVRQKDGSVIRYGFSHNNNQVTFDPRPEGVITWAALSLLNNLSLQFIHAARNGTRE